MVLEQDTQRVILSGIPTVILRERSERRISSCHDEILRLRLRMTVGKHIRMTVGRRLRMTGGWTQILCVLLLLSSSVGFAKDLVKSETVSPEGIADVEVKEATLKAQLERRRNRLRLFTVGERKELAIERINKAIKLTEDLYAKTTSPELKFNLSLKLSKMYFDKAQGQIVVAEEAYEKQLQAYLASGPSVGSKPPPPPTHADARAVEDKAVVILEKAIKTPGRADLDEPLYFLGLIYANRGEFKKSRPYYNRIMNEYPQSEFRWEAKLMVAEGYFEDGQFESALKLYNELIAAKPTVSYPQYKKAWVLFNLKRFDQSIDLFLTLFKNGRKLDAAAADKEISTQIISDMVLIYTDALQIKPGIAFYDALAPAPESYTHLHKMAKALNENGFYEQARAVANHLFAKYTSSPIIPLAITTYLDTFKEFVHDVLKYHQKIVTELSQKLKTFPPAQMAATNPKTIETYQELERFVVKQAKNLHSEAQKMQKQLDAEKQKDKRLLANAQARFDSAIQYYKAYETFFTSWPHAKFALNMAFYHGELEFQLGRYPAAADAYVLALRLRSRAQDAKEQKFLQEALYGAVVSYDKQLGTQETARERRKGTEDLAVKPLSSEASKFLQVASLYLQQMRGHSVYQQIAYRSAKVYYDHNNFQKAVPIFLNTIQINPGTQLARFSADLILDSYNALKDYTGLIQAGQQLLAIPNLGDSAYKSSIQKLMDESRFKAVEGMEKQQDFSAAADAYLQLGTSEEGGLKKSALGEMALNNAAVNYIKANQWAQAMQAYGTLIATYPKSKFRKDAMLSSAEYHQLMGNFAESQKLYKQYVKDYPSKAAGYTDLVYHVAFVAENLAQHEDALATYKKYLQLKPAAMDRSDVIARMCVSAAAIGEKSLALVRSTYEGTASARTRTICEYEHIKNRLKSGASIAKELAQIKSTLKKHIPAHEREIIAPFFTQQVQDLKAAYERQRLVDTPAEKSGPLLQQKLDLLKKMDSLVVKISGYGVLSALISAMKTLSLSYVDLSDDILGSPIPAGLTTEDEATYRSQIAQIASPLRQKGIDSMKSMIETAGSLKVPSPELASVWRQYDALTNVRSRMPDWFESIELMPFYLPTSKGDSRLKSYYAPVSFESFSISRGGLTLPDVSDQDDKSRLYYEILALCGRADYTSAWRKLIPTLAQDPKNIYLLNLLAFLKTKSNQHAHGLLILQLAQKTIPPGRSAAERAQISDVLTINEALTHIHSGELDQGIAILESLSGKNALADMIIGYIAIKYYNFYWARTAFYTAKPAKLQDDDALWLSLGEGIAKMGTFDGAGALGSFDAAAGSRYRPVLIAALPIQAAILISMGQADKASATLISYQQLQDTHHQRRDWVKQLR